MRGLPDLSGFFKIIRKRYVLKCHDIKLLILFVIQDSPLFSINKDVPNFNTRNEKKIIHACQQMIIMVLLFLRKN